MQAFYQHEVSSKISSQNAKQKPLPAKDHFTLTNESDRTLSLLRAQRKIPFQKPHPTLGGRQAK
jgi:hypothetical protein